MGDANAFVVLFQEAIERSVPHIYLSALPFAAKNSKIYASYLPKCTGLVSAETFGIEPHSGRLAMSLAGHADSVSSIAYLPDGRLASGSFGGMVRIWDTRTGHESMPPFVGQDGAVLSLAVAPTGMNLASGNQNGSVCIWNLESPWEPPRRLLGHSGLVFLVAFSPDGLLASVAEDGLRLWRPETGQQLSMTCIKINSGAFSPDGKIFASCYAAKTQFWNVITGNAEALHTLYHEKRVLGFCFSPDSRKLAAGLYNSTIELWDMTSRTIISTLCCHSERVEFVQFFPDGMSLMSILGNAEVHIWNLHRDVGNQNPARIYNSLSSVNSATISPDGLYIALTSGGSDIQIWDARVGQTVAQPCQAHNDSVDSVAVSSDGEFIASVSCDRSIRIWDIHTGKPKLPPLPGGVQPMSCVAISPDGCLIASSEDYGVRLWDASTGEAVGGRLRGHSSAVRAVCFSPNSRWLASASKDNTVRIWDVERGQK